jgi:Bifunctional DNA primase/polymerase, N-terminal
MSSTDYGPDTPTTCLERALLLLGHGLPCFPCAITKKPTTPRGFKDATCDPDALCQLWKKHPGLLVGVPTGGISGLDVLDIDARHGGGSWLAEHKHRLPSTRVHRTRRAVSTCFFSISSG